MGTTIQVISTSSNGKSLRQLQNNLQRKTQKNFPQKVEVKKSGCKESGRLKGQELMNKTRSGNSKRGIDLNNLTIIKSKSQGLKPYNPYRW